MKNIFQLVCDTKLCFYYLLIASQDPQFRHFKSLKCFIYIDLFHLLSLCFDDQATGLHALISESIDRLYLLWHV